LPALPPAEQIGGILSGRLQDKADIKADIAPQRPAADVQPEHRPPAKTEILGIQLEPQSLGRVTIKMRLAGTALDLRIEAEQPETLRLLEREKGLLGSKLQAAGYSLDSLLIQLSEPQASHPSASLDLGAYEHDLQSSQHQGGEAGYGGPPAREHNPWLPPAAERNQESASDGSPSGIYI
jgi:chemotaxis protein MotD